MVLLQLLRDHILEQHIHNIDVANWFIGDYLYAQGMGGRQVRKGKDNGEIFDHHLLNSLMQMELLFLPRAVTFQAVCHVLMSF